MNQPQPAHKPTADARLRVAHRARRAKEHQLDDIRRALCDVGAMKDDDPYSHADLADVIRRAGKLDKLQDALMADLDAEADSLAEPDLSREAEIRGVQGWMAMDLHQALGWSLNGGASHQGRKTWSDWWAELLAEVRILTRTGRLRDERADRLIGEEGPDAKRRAARRANIREQMDRLGRRGILGVSSAELLRNQVEAEMREADTARSVAAGNLRHVKTLVPELEAALAAVDRVRRLCEMTIAQSVRVHAIDQARDTLAALDRRSAKAPPEARLLACGLCYEAQDEEVHPHPECPIGTATADVQRVVDLYERWVKAGGPPLGVSISRWWDARLVELCQAINSPVSQPGRPS